jgi:hypothetical protein
MTCLCEHNSTVMNSCSQICPVYKDNVAAMTMLEVMAQKCKKEDTTNSADVKTTARASSGCRALAGIFIGAVAITFL